MFYNTLMTSTLFSFYNYARLLRSLFLSSSYFTCRLSCFGFLIAINFKSSIPVSFPSCQRNSTQKMTFHFLGYRDYTHETRNYHSSLDLTIHVLLSLPWFGSIVVPDVSLCISLAPLFGLCPGSSPMAIWSQPAKQISTRYNHPHNARLARKFCFRKLVVA